MSCLNVNNDNNLKKFNTEHKKGVWFVWFYAEWCGHCRDMHHDWEELTNNNTHNVNLAKIEHDYVSGVENNPPVQGYPTIVLYKNGKVVGIYQGERKQEAFNNYLSNNLDANELTSHNINSGINVNTNTNQNNSVVRLQKPKKQKKSKKKKSVKAKKSQNASNNNTSNNSSNSSNSKKTVKRKGSKKKKSTKKKKAKKASGTN